MASQDSIARFLKEELGYPDSAQLRQLEALAGQDLGRVRFLAGLDAARAALEPWMPVFFLPVAQASVTWGLHLRPGDVQRHRLAVAAGGPGEFVEVGLEPAQAVYRALLGAEGHGNTRGMPPSLAGAIERANGIFGAGFYQLGRHGAFKAGDETLVMVEAGNPTPEAVGTQAAVADDAAAALSLRERGIAAGVESLELHAGAARSLLALGRREEAARQAAQSLECYHHTANDVDLEEYFDEVRPLLQEFPAHFSEDAAWQLREADPRAWARRAAELFRQGAAARADKLLNDLCHGTGDYDAALGAFRQHYAALGWDWALALCELRG